MALRRTEPHTVARELGYIRLWRDDLAEIVFVMRQVAPDLTLSTDTYDLDSVDDLAKIGEESIAKFVATSADSRIHFEVGPRRSYIFAVDSDLLTRGMLDEVQRIARRRPRRLVETWNKPALRISSGLILLAVAIPLAIGFERAGVFTGSGDRLPGWLAWSVVAATAAAAAAGAASGRSQRADLAKISTRLYVEKPPWLVRNRDALVTNAIVSFVFLIIGIVVGYLLPKP